VGTVTFGTVTFGTVTVGTVTVGTVTFGTVTTGVVTVGVEIVGVFTGVVTVGTVSDGTVIEGIVRALLRCSCPRDTSRAMATPTAHPSTRVITRGHPDPRSAIRDRLPTCTPSRVRTGRRRPPFIVRENVPIPDKPETVAPPGIPARREANIERRQ
jgi:hypothetical protein